MSYLHIIVPVFSLDLSLLLILRNFMAKSFIKLGLAFLASARS